jgi:hypothetical protein
MMGDAFPLYLAILSIFTLAISRVMQAAVQVDGGFGKAFDTAAWTCNFLGLIMLKALYA